MMLLELLGHVDVGWMRWRSGLQFLGEFDDALRGFQAFVDFGDQRHADAVARRD